ASGHRLSGICVGAATQEQVGLDFGVFTDIEFTYNGSYLMQNLPPNPYLIQFGCTSGRYASQWFRSQPDSTTADLVSVGARITTTASARLGPARLGRPGSIAGTVTDKAGHRLSRICLIVYNARNKIALSLSGPLTLTSKGRYVVSGLTPGRYLVEFLDCRQH